MAFFLESYPGLKASVRLSHVNRKTTLRWYVDNDDDRYVEATDCVNSNNVVVTSVDGFKASVFVLSDLKSIMATINQEVRCLARGSEKAVEK
jgi:hypothetical protein